MILTSIVNALNEPVSYNGAYYSKKRSDMKANKLVYLLNARFLRLQIFSHNGY